MSTEHAYRVIVTRGGDAWLADIPELEGAYGMGASTASRRIVGS